MVSVSGAGTSGSALGPLGARLARGRPSASRLSLTRRALTRRATYSSVPLQLMDILRRYRMSHLLGRLLRRAYIRSTLCMWVEASPQPPCLYTIHSALASRSPGMDSDAEVLPSLGLIRRSASHFRRSSDGNWRMFISIIATRALKKRERAHLQGSSSFALRRAIIVHAATRNRSDGWLYAILTTLRLTYRLVLRFQDVRTQNDAQHVRALSLWCPCYFHQCEDALHRCESAILERR